MAVDASPIGLSGVVLADVTGGPPVDLGASPGRALVTVIRHRH